MQARPLSEVCQKLEQLRRDVGIEVLIPGDTHINGPYHANKMLLSVLDAAQPATTLLIGDTFDHRDIFRESADATYPAMFRRLMAENTIFIAGNHDRDLLAQLSALLGVCLATHEEYVFEVAGIRMLATHGDRWDKITSRYKKMTNLGSWTYHLLCKIEGKDRALSGKVKKKFNRWRVVADAVAQGSYDRAVAERCTVAFTGHTHMPREEVVHGVHLVNVGSFTLPEPSFAVVTGTGAVRLFVVKREQE